MTVAKYRAALIALLGLAGVLLFMLSRSAERLNQLEIRPTYFEEDSDVVEMAFREAARAESVPVEVVKRMDFALVIEFPDRRCVQIASTLETAGRTSIYCFLKPDNRLVERHRLKS
jgi:hypothetical protein